MSELARLIFEASPLQLVLAILSVLLVVGAMTVAPILKLEAKAWFLRRRGVGRKELAAWALSEAKRDRPNPLVEIIHALRRRGSL